MMRMLKFAAVALVVSAMSAALSAGAAQRGQRGNQPQTPVASDVPGDATSVGRRLYLGVLGREADPGGLAGAVADIQRGRVSAVVDAFLASDEFRTVERRKSASQLLDQFYRGLLQRAPDQGGIQMYESRVARRQYADVIMALVSSDEFRNSLTATASNTPPARPTPTPVPSAPAVSRVSAALECQGKVIDLVRKDAGGRVFVTFDRLPEVSADGQNVSGPAMDRVVDRGERPMSYRCAGRDVSYSYDDRRGPVAMDSRVNYPSAAVRNCQNAIRNGLAFDAASLSASDTSAEYVLGLTGGTVRQCTMDRQTVVSVK